jgi:hypothetical protein
MFYENEKKVAVILFCCCVVAVAMLAICSGVTGKSQNHEPEIQDNEPFLVETLADDLESYQENKDLAAENLCRRNKGVFRSAWVGYDCIINDQNKRITCSNENTCYFQ